MDRTKIEAARKAVCLVAKKMAEEGLTAGTWGNFFKQKTAYEITV